jgi:ABC-type multidrug transport system ATPase subunit
MQINNYSPEPAGLTIKNISKCFHGHSVFSGISLHVSEGTRLLLLGANGSGKSTLLRMCVGLSRPDSGKVEFQKDKSVGYFAHSLMLYSSLTVLEHINFFLSLASLEVLQDSLIKDWDLNLILNKKLNSLSRGQQYRLSLALTLFSKPRYVFLDEPSAFLDQNMLNRLISSVLDECDNKITICATHDVERLRDIANRVVVLGDAGIRFDTGLIKETDQASRSLIEQAVSVYRQSNR